MAEKKTLNSILKELNKKYGDENHPAATVGVEDLRSYGTLSLGSPGLDFCLYNTFPERRVVEFCGAEGSGKTTLAFITAASYIRRELERNPENPRGILYVDLEMTADPEWAYKMGYDMNRDDVKTIRFFGLDMSAETIFNNIIDIIKTEEIGLVIIDSLNMLVPMQVFEESLEKKEMGGIAKPLGDFVKRVTPLLVRYDCTLVGINQLRENIGGYGNPLTTSGGRGWKHSCSVRLMLKKGAFFDEDYNVVTGTAENPAGYVLECAVLKTKTCPWDRKLGRTNINYVRGIDIMQDTIEVATHFGLIDNSVQGSFKIIDPDTGLVRIDADGNEVKIRGKKNIKPYFESHLDEYRKLYDNVYEMLSRRSDPNIKSFEAMLNCDVGEKFGVDFAKEEE